MRDMFQRWKESKLLDEDEATQLEAYIEHRAHVEQRREDYKKQRESLQPLHVSSVSRTPVTNLLTLDYNR